MGEKCCEAVSRLGRKSSDGLCCQPCVASLKAEVVGGDMLYLQFCPFSAILSWGKVPSNPAEPDCHLG